MNTFTSFQGAEVAFWQRRAVPCMTREASRPVLVYEIGDEHIQGLIAP